MYVLKWSPIVKLNIFNIIQICWSQCSCVIGAILLRNDHAFVYLLYLNKGRARRPPMMMQNPATMVPPPY